MKKIEDFKESLETDEIAEALDDYWTLLGAEAVRLNESLSSDPEYQITPKVEHRLQRSFAHWQRRNSIHCKRRLRIMLAAALLLALLIAANASAVRAIIGNYFLSFSDESADITEHAFFEAYYNHNVLKPTYLPEGFKEYSTTENVNVTEIIYRDITGEEIKYATYADATSVRLDHEDAKEIMQVQVSSQDGILIIKDGLVNLVWGEHPPRQLRGPAHLKAALMKMAESVNTPDYPVNKQEETTK